MGAGASKSNPIATRLFYFRPEKYRRNVRIYTEVIVEPMPRFEMVDPETMIRPAPGGVSGGILDLPGL